MRPLQQRRRGIEPLPYLPETPFGALAAAMAFAGTGLLCNDGSPANVGDLWVLACAADRLTSTMIRFAAPQSTIPSRKQSRACGIDENA